MIYLYDVLRHVDSVWLAEPIMYLDCHVTVRAPQPFVSEAELILIVLVLRHPLLLVTLIVELAGLADRAISIESVHRKKKSGVES